MPDYCSYLSDTFIHDIWLKFSSPLKRQKTLLNYLAEINSICSYLKCDFLDITTSSAQTYYDYLFAKGTLTIKSIHTKLGYCRSIGSYIADNRDILNLSDYMNPFFRVNIASYNTFLEPDKVPTLDMIDKLLSYCKKNGDEQLYLIISLVVRCSLTTSQICSLKTKMIFIDKAGTCCIVFPGKPNLKRLRVPSDVASLLFDHMNRCGETEDVFFNAKGGPLKEVPLQRKMASLSEQALGRSVTLQDLRNSSIALMLAGGAPSAEVSTYCDIAPRWLYRFNTVVDDIQSDSCDYANFTIKLD